MYAADEEGSGDSEESAGAQQLQLNDLPTPRPQQAQLHGFLLLEGGERPGLKVVELGGGDGQGPSMRVALPAVTGEFAWGGAQEPAAQQDEEQQR